MPRFTPFLPLVLLLGPACGDAQAPVAESPADTPADAPAAEEPTLPHGHVPNADEAPAAESGRWTGDLVLRGDLATATTGVVFLSVTLEDGAQIGIVQKRDLAEEDLPPAQGGVRRIPFVLDGAEAGVGFARDTEMVMIEARFDSDGFAETREGNVTAFLGAPLRADGLEVVLDPSGD